MAAEDFFPPSATQFPQPEIAQPFLQVNGEMVPVAYAGIPERVDEMNAEQADEQATVDAMNGNRYMPLVHKFQSGLVMLMGAFIAGHHGYARTRNVGWTVVWTLAGGMLPIITVPVALAQGYAKPKRR